MRLRDEHGQRQPLAVEKISSCGDAKAHGGHTEIDEISMRSWVSHPLRDPGQLDAALAQFLCPLWRGRLEIDIDGLLPEACRIREVLSCDRAVLRIPLGPPQAGLRGTSREK
ncbi:hypothetical protein [Archangium sp.]|uniref:hypothetical protein n=1 Tax=Archangium sp. TaxID=1872627 RepID=UPI002D37EC94|nr:hypothetical protein [Archangium sp.]HYO56625.1 hypothetical protein [Archangium sp.]